ncbi:MAG: hypothetical protein LBF92_03425, partial [Synergistaceae bacterium]|nr:hypothetical protein [Synergistaceae bacterium]
MKMKPVAVPVIVLLASFLAAIAPCTPAMAASPSLWISGTPASGQFNNGLISPVGPDATAPSTKLYYLSSSSPSSRPRVGLTLRGAGFEPDTSVGFGIEGKQNEPTEPWGTGTYSLPAPVMTDSNGDFEYSVTFSRASPSAYNKFDVDGGEKLIIYPTYPNDKSSENPDGRIDGVQVALTIHPTVILLPRALDAVTMYAGTDYSISGAEDNGVASMIIIDDSSRQVRLAVAGMSLRGPGNANIPRENETWRLSNGVTAAANADNSYIVLRTPESGVSGEMNGMFSVLGTGASVVSDGFASVAGFPKTSEALIATFSLQVKKSDRSASPEHSSFVFKNNEAVNASVIFETTFNTTPQNLAIGDLLIVDPATKQRVKSLSVLGGLVMTADSGRRAVTFSGTPVIEGGEGEGSYDVVWITTDGEALPSTIDVNVSAGDVYAPGYTDDVIGDGYIPESRPYWRTGKSVPETPRGIRVLKADGSEVPLKLTVDDDHGLEGLDIKVNSDNKGITISGTPTFSGLKTFYVNVAIDPAGGVSGTVSPNRVPFSVFVDDATYQLSFDKEKLEVPVGKEFNANVKDHRADIRKGFDPEG